MWGDAYGYRGKGKEGNDAGSGGFKPGAQGHGFMPMGVILSGWKGGNGTGDGVVMTAWGTLLLASGGLLEARNAA